MVMSADGRATIESNENGLGSDVDQRLMRELRAVADMVLVGAGTLRATGASSRVRDDDLEQLRIDREKTRNPISAVITRSGDLPLERLFFTAVDFDSVVYLSQEASVERKEAIEATGRPVVALDSDDELASMLLHMREKLQVDVLLVEGGPTLNGDLFSQGLVDEFFLTLGSVVVGGEPTLSPVTGMGKPTTDSVTRLELAAAVKNAESSEVYLRYKMQVRSTPAS